MFEKLIVVVYMLLIYDDMLEGKSIVWLVK